MSYETEPDHIVDSIEQLEENVRIAHEFNPLSEAEMTELAKKAEPVHRQALFFRRWSS